MRQGMLNAAGQQLTNVGEQALHEILGYRLRCARAEKKLTQEKLASLVNISRASLANIERGHQTISVYMLYKLATKLDVAVMDLFPEQIRNPQQDSSLNLPIDLSSDLRDWITKEAANA